MLLDEDPAALIHECAANFSTQPDRACLLRIHSSLTSLTTARHLRLTTASAASTRLTRAHHAATQSHALTLAREEAAASSASGAAGTGGMPADHAAAMLALDARKFRIAKEAAELEVEAERLGSEARAAEALRNELDRQGEAGAGVSSLAEDEAVLKLKVYRSLGIALEEDAAPGAAARAVVWSKRRGTAEVVPLGGPGADRNTVDMLWRAL